MLVQAAGSHTPLKEVITSKSKSTILASVRLCWWVRGEAGQQCFSERWPERETQPGMVSELLLFVIAALGSHNLASNPIGFISPENIKEKLSFCLGVCLLFFLKDWKVVFNHLIFLCFSLLENTGERKERVEENYVGASWSDKIGSKHSTIFVK